MCTHLLGRQNRRIEKPSSTQTFYNSCAVPRKPAIGWRFQLCFRCLRCHWHMYVQQNSSCPCTRLRSARCLHTTYRQPNIYPLLGDWSNAYQSILRHANPPPKESSSRENSSAFHRSSLRDSKIRSRCPPRMARKMTLEIERRPHPRPCLHNNFGTGMETVEAPTTIIPITTLWWCRLIKRKLKQLYMREGAARRREAKIMENHYYECMYAALRDKRPPDEKFVSLNRLRAKIVNFHSAPCRRHSLTRTNTTNNPTNNQRSFQSCACRNGAPPD